MYYVNQIIIWQLMVNVKQEHQYYVSMQMVSMHIIALINVVNMQTFKWCYQQIRISINKYVYQVYG